MELSFAFPALLWALPAALLPVAIHFRARMRERTVDFPGAFFLEQPAQPVPERRRKLEDLGLLILRCVLLAAAVCALAGPRVKGLGLSGGDAADLDLALCVVVDDSPSFAAQRDARGEGVAARALHRLVQAAERQGVRRIAGEFASGRRVPWTAPTEIVAEEAGATVYSGDRTGALTRALRRFEEIEAAERAVVLLTDGQRNAGEGTASALAARWSSALEAFGKRGAPLLLICEPPEAPARQWRIEAPRPAPGQPEALAGETLRMQVRVACERGGGSRQIRVRMAALDTPDAAPSAGAPAILLERSVALSDGQSVELEFPALAARPGALWFDARFTDADERPFDDRAEAVWTVAGASPVWLWDLRAPDERPAAGKPDGAWEALRAALDPLDGLPGDRVELRNGPPAAAPEDETGLLVALHGPDGPRVPPDQAERLRAWVEAGLQLVWLPDLQRVREGANPSVAAREAGDEPLWPRGISFAEVETRGWKLGLSEPEHPLIAPFRDGRNGALLEIPLPRRLRLALPARGAPEDIALLRFEDGAPAWLWRPLGVGAVHQWAFGAAAGDALSASPAWPVLWAGLAEYARRPRGGWSAPDEIAPGEAAPVAIAARPKPRRIFVDGPWAFPEPPVAPSSWTLEVPAGAGSFQLPALAEPGVYRLREDGRSGASWMTCRTAALESGLGRWPDEIERALRSAAAAHVGEPEAIFGELAARRPGRSAAPWLWVLAGVLMALELGAQIWRGRAA
ncbi:MAG: BatA domain-containing protein [Planctomycetes bacterium]|nr:BatA domain-containing protein [Planctomycetota bacterium]